MLGLAFSITLIQSTWKTAIERKQKDFHFEILSIQQSVATNVLTGNDVTNNVAAFISSNNDISSNQFNTFADDILERYKYIEAINYYTFTGNDRINEFPLIYKRARDDIGIYLGEDIYFKPKYRDAIDTSITSGSVVPAPPDVENNVDRKYWLFKAIYSHNPSTIKNKIYSGVVTGMVSILVSPTKLLGDKGLNNSLTITMFSDTSNIYGRQLLYFNDPDKKDADKAWKVDTLIEEKLIQLPPYSIKIIIEKNLYFSDLEYHLLLVALLISVGIIMMLYGLVRAKVQQEEELKQRNSVIEKKVEEQTYELAIARDEALEAVRMKSEFLASMSHEIRTPLNAIIGMSDLMSETPLTDEQNRYVSVFKKAGDALLGLVNDILDLSKMEAEQLVLEKIPFNLMDVIDEAAEIYALKAADKGIEIITDISTNVNLNRVGDPGRLKQIILNLISNALKFTDEGEIVISLSAEVKQGKENFLIICIKDTGIGIAKDKLETIFASFSQADTSTTRKYGGTGLGLTISRHLIGMMNGKIWVESDENIGSCFYIKFELPEQIDQTQGLIIRQDLSQKDILIVDSRMSNCDSIARQLIASGAICHKAINTDEANTILKQEVKPDIIILESRLAFIKDNLSDFVSGMKQRDNLILLVNPKDMSRHSRSAKENEINKILLKPVKCRELFHHIHQTLKPADKKKIDRDEDADQYEKITPKHILLVEDNPDNRLLIKAYLKKTPHTLVEAENGSIAVEMFKQDDYDLVFMDVQMPVMDGHEATKQIRAWEIEQNKERTKIISLTAHAIKEEVDKCIAAGCDTHLSKPIKKVTLLQTIEELS
jgi:signal transduction histidine kinase/PleD family two-component response regulator